VSKPNPFAKAEKPTKGKPFPAKGEKAEGKKPNPFAKGAMAKKKC
jgi:hypothetical protein